MFAKAHTKNTPAPPIIRPVEALLISVFMVWVLISVAESLTFRDDQSKQLAVDSEMINLLEQVRSLFLYIVDQFPRQ